MPDVQTELRLADLRAEIARYTPEFISKTSIDLVKSALKNETLTLVLGAGVSSGLKLPLWGRLVRDLYNDVYGRIDPSVRTGAITGLLRSGHTTNEALIRHLESLASFRSVIRKMLRDRLYKKYDEAGTKQLIEPICKIFLRNKAAHRTNHVITYNFDNALERQLRRMGRPNLCSIYSAETYPLKDGGLRIYHPHGYLPHPEDDAAGTSCLSEVVFSERDYNLHFMEPNHWANVLQLHHFMNRTCLFIGLSMADRNMRRLLDHAHVSTQAGARHVSIQKSKGTPLADQYIERDLASLGVRTLWVRDYADIPKVLKKCAAVR